MQTHVDACSSHSLDKLAEDAAATDGGNQGKTNPATVASSVGTPQPSLSFADEQQQQDQQEMPESLRKKTYANLFVQGLHPSVTDAILGSWFKPFGDVRSAKVMLNVRTGVSRGFGFILFDDESVGLRACDAMQGKVMVTPRRVALGAPAAAATATDTATQEEQEALDAAEAVSTLAIEPSQHDGDRAAAESNVIYLRNIPAEVSERAAVAACAAYGKMQSFTMAPIVPRHAAARRKQRQQQQQHQGDGEAATADDAAGSPTYAAVGGGSMIGAHSLDATAIAAVVEADRAGVPVSPKPPTDDSPSRVAATTTTTTMAAATASSADDGPAAHQPVAHLFLATIEYESVDGARAAIRALHQSKPWQACGIPLLAKYADTDELKRHRQEQRKARQILLQKQQEQREREKQEDRLQRRKAASAAGSLAASPTALSAPSSLTAGSTPQRIPPLPAATATAAARDDDLPMISGSLPAATTTTASFGPRALRDKGGGIGGSSVPVDGGLEYRAAEASQQQQQPQQAHSNTRSPATSRRTNTGPVPQSQPASINGGAAGNVAPPTQPGQVVYYKGTLQALGDGTFRMLAPELIKYQQQHPHGHHGPTVSPPPPPSQHRTPAAPSATSAASVSTTAPPPPELAHLATAAAAAAAAGAAQPPVTGVHIPAAAANPAAASIMYQQQQHAAATAAAAAAAVQQQVYFAQLAAAQQAAPPPLSAASMAAMQQQQQQQMHGVPGGGLADPGPSVSEMPTPQVGPASVSDRNTANNAGGGGGAATPGMPADVGGMMGASLGGNSFFGQHGLVPVTVGQSVGGTHQHMYVLPDVHGLGGGQSYSQSFRGGDAGAAAPAWQQGQGGGGGGAGSLASSLSQLSRIQQQQQHHARASQQQQQQPPLPPAMQPGGAGGGGGRPSVGGTSLGGDLLDLRAGNDSPSHIET